MNVTLCDECLPADIETLTIGRLAPRPCDCCGELVAPDAGGVVTVRILTTRAHGPGLPTMAVEHVMGVKRALDLAELVTWPNGGAPERLGIYCHQFIIGLGDAGVVTPATAREAHRRLAIEASGGPHRVN